MPNKTLSRVIVPDVLLNSTRPALSVAWAIAVAGWAVSLSLLIASGLITDLSSGFRGGIDAAFANVGVIFVGGLVTVLVVTAVVRLRASQSDHISLLLFSAAFVLFILIGALAIVLGVIGFFVAFSDNGWKSVAYSLFQHIGGVVLGVVLIVWSLGELTAMLRAAPDVAGAKAKGVAKVIPSAVLDRPELTSSWELVVAGWLVAAWLFSIGAFTLGAVADLYAAVALLLVGGPLGIAVITVAARLRAAETGPLGAFSIDGALLLSMAFGVVLIVLGVFNVFKALTVSGFGYVLGGIVWAVGGAVMGVLTVVWAAAELAAQRHLLPGATLAVLTMPGTPLASPSAPVAPFSASPPPPPPPPTATVAPIVPPPPPPGAGPQA